MIRSCRQPLGCTAVLLSILSPSVCGQANQPEPDPAALIKAGQETMRRFQAASASWTVINETPSGVQFIVAVETTPQIRRSILVGQDQGQRTELARVIERDGAWYVTQRGKAGKYRPYEAPLDLPSAYLYLNRSDLVVITAESAAGLGTYAGTEAGVATYRSPLPEPVRRQAESTIADLEATARNKPGQSGNPELAKVLDTLRDLLVRGLEIRVDAATGIILQRGTSQRRSRVVDFRWRERIDLNDFAVDGRNWDDFSDDPTVGDLDDLVMIAHSAMWRPGVKNHETDGRLINVKTGRYRRIRFQGASVMPGCFLAGRTRVVVTGIEAAGDGTLGLFEVDLKTGENRRLGGELLAGGLTMFPTLSPDGKTLAVVHKGADQHLLDSQVCLVDVKTGAARPLGAPHDFGPVSWLPDGQGLIILVRVPDVANNRRTDNIARLDLDGNLTHLREGSMPVLLGDGHRILFKDSETDTWRTCHLDGQKVQPYADGLKSYGFPAPGPDGKRLMMMQFQTGKAPVPVVLPIGASSGKPATTAPGLWALPSWR
jgi:hypothetical protein